jgi:hypothetical protein
MAIYRHVRNKSHLLDLMVERLLDQVDLAPAETATWIRIPIQWSVGITGASA